MRILSKLLIAGTLLSGGVASADGFRNGGAERDARPAPTKVGNGASRDHRDGNDDRTGYGRNANPRDAQARPDHIRQRRGYTWVEGQWTKQHRRWVWVAGHYQRIARF